VDYAARRIELKRQIEDAQDAAVETREGLLYGTSQQLVSAVRSVFETAGIKVVDLDEKFGDTKNADLLCTYGGSSRLVEVKSANGSAPERAYEDLIRHQREWPSLPEASPIDGGALVISHDLRKVPLERKRKPYTRPEFLSAQTEPVISALELFAAWRDDNSGAIRELLFGSITARVSEEASHDAVAVANHGTDVSSPMRRRWFGWR
jgi:hypothetical protein